MSNQLRNHTRLQGPPLFALAFCTTVVAACSADAKPPGVPTLPAAESGGATAAPKSIDSPPAAATAGMGASVAAAAGMALAASGAGAPSMVSAAGAASAAVSTGGVCDGTRNFTRAVRVEIGVEWPATIGLDAGSGKVIVYSKVRYRKSGDQWLTEARPCGTELPVITTSLLVNNLKSVNRIPSAAFDSPLMPVVQGVVAREGGMLTIDAGGRPFGVELPAPDAAWPSAEALKPVDHDGDGKPGVTAFPEVGEGYIIPPLSVAQDRTADQVYVAARVLFRLRAPQQRCEELSGGTAAIAGFDYAIIGCHAMDGVECAEGETRFLARAAPVFTVAPTGPWTQREVPDDASCARVQAAFAP